MLLSQTARSSGARINTHLGSCRSAGQSPGRCAWFMAVGPLRLKSGASWRHCSLKAPSFLPASTCYCRTQLPETMRLRSSYPCWLSVRAAFSPETSLILYHVPPQNKAAGNASSLESHGLLYLSFSQDGLWWEKMDSGSLVGYMGCHLLSLFDLYKMKALVAQSCLTLCSPMDCSPPGSSVHGILQARESSYSLVQQIFPIQGFLHCKQILYSLSHQGSPQNSAT